MASRRNAPWSVWRVADIRRVIFDGTGAMLRGARWNSPGRRVIYAAETYAGALLEVLVHASGSIPKNQARIRIDIPAGIAIERVAPADLPGWDSSGFAASRQYGDHWYDARRTLVLVVPSIVTRLENNVLINQDHPDFAKISATEPEPVYWDTRLFRKPL
jgi:RES domain-containing protein